MNRIQIVAKAAYNGLCFLIVGVLLYSYRYIGLEKPPDRSWVFLPIAAVSALLIVWLLRRGLKNFHLAWKLAGTVPADTVQLDEHFFVIAMRFVVVCAGLLMLASFSDVFPQTVQTAADLIGSGRDFFQLLLEGELVSALDMGMVGVIKLFYPVGLLVWIVYLLTGARRIVLSQRQLAQIWLANHKQIRSGL